MNEAKDIDCDLFLLGQRDCMEGRPHKAGMGESYDRGFAAQYAFDQIRDVMTGGDDGK